MAGPGFSPPYEILCRDVKLPKVSAVLECPDGVIGHENLTKPDIAAAIEAADGDPGAAPDQLLKFRYEWVW